MHIGIFGCGQLAQMTAKAGIKLGLSFAFVAEPGEDVRCVESLGPVVVLDADITAAALFEALGRPAVITVEKEMVDTEWLQSLQSLTTVSPGSDAIHIAQNRIREKNFLRDQGIPTADFDIVGSVSQLESLATHFGYPMYIKAAESGYDGYHQWRIQHPEDMQQPALIGAMAAGVSLIAEKHVAYRRELSVIAVRGKPSQERKVKGGSATVVLYPLMENRHEDGVLISTMAPAPDIAPTLEVQAFAFIERLLTRLDYVGALTMECFETDQGIVVNELAPRVHNSGHWTIEGSRTSQFENHCRAIAGMALGETTVAAMAGFVNMLGKHGDASAFSSEAMYYHAYGKQERARRKLGHITTLATDREQLRQSLNQVLTSLYGDRYPLWSGQYLNES